MDSFSPFVSNKPLFPVPGKVYVSAPYTSSSSSSSIVAPSPNTTSNSSSNNPSATSSDDDNDSGADYFEDEVAKGLTKDDATILEDRYRHRTRKTTKKTFQSSLPPSSSKAVKERQDRISKNIKSQTQWTRALDAVQEHFSSHVTLDGSSHKLPPSIYALKTIAKHNWVLYKKRECERRKRIRRKLEREKEKERSGKPANILMAMVDSCEVCKRLYVTVNLFWGVTLCDSCYFTPGVINDIMKSRGEIADQKMSYTPENIVKEVIKYRKDYFASNKNYFEVEPSSSEKSTTTVITPTTKSPTATSSTSPNLAALEKVELAESIVRGKDNPFFEDEDDSFDGYTTSSDTEEQQSHKKPSSSSLKLAPFNPPPTPCTPLLIEPPPPSPFPTLPPTPHSSNFGDSQAFFNDVVDYFNEGDVDANNAAGALYSLSQISSQHPIFSGFSQQMQPFRSGGNGSGATIGFFHRDSSQNSNLFTDNPLSFEYESTKYKSPR